MKGPPLLSPELVLLLKQAWIGDLPQSQLSLSQRLTHYGLMRTPSVQSAFSTTDRATFTSDSQPYANLPHDIGFGEKMTIPSMHAVALEALAPVVHSDTRKVIDIGCGAGCLTHCLGKMAPNAAVLGLDLNLKLLEKAKSHTNIPQNVTFRRADIREIIDDEFDAIHVGFNITEELTDEIRIKLKPGGLLWAPVISKSTQGVTVQLVDSLGGSRDVIDMEYSPIRMPVSDLEDKLKAVEGEIKAIYEELQRRLGKSITLKDFPASIQPLLKERKILLAKIKRYST